MLVLITINMSAPVIYSVTKKIPFNIFIIWQNAKGNDAFAKAVVFTYGVSVLLITVLLVLAFTK